MLHVDLVGLQIVETWRCSHCGRRFKRKTDMGRLFGQHPPRGFEAHRRTCGRERARQQLTSDELTEMVARPRRRRKGVRS